MGAGCSAPGAGCAGGDLRCCRRGRVPAGSPGMEGVLSPARGAGAAVEQAGAREPGLAAAQGAVLCSGHVGFAPCPAGGAAEGRGEWVPSPGRAPRGEGGLPAPARQGRSLCPLGRFPLWPVAVCGCRRGPGGPLPQPTPSRGQAGWCRTFWGAGAGAVGVRPRPRRHWCGAGPGPGGCWALWAQSDCPTSLPVQGRTDGRTEEPSHAGSCGAPRKKPGCLRRGRRSSGSVVWDQFILLLQLLSGLSLIHI